MRTLRFKKSYREKGQSLFELILAIGVSAIIIVVLVSLVSNALQNAAFSRNETLAARHAQTTTEWLRAQRDNNIDNFIANAAIPTWCLTDNPLTDSSWNNQGACGANEVVSGTIFKREVLFTINNVSGKTIILSNVAVSWDDSKGKHKVTNATQFSDWRQRQ
jgi:Tfp pilus assembly protein PilV